MSYAQFHDGFYRNLKVRRAGSAAAWMWAASIGYANEHLTDGFVPVEVLPELSELDSKPRLKLAARLVEVGLWEVAEGGWRVHDFLKWNFSREQVLARREQVLARVNKHRTNAVSHGEGNARVTRYNERDSERTNAVSNRLPNTKEPKTSPDAEPEVRHSGTSAKGAGAPPAAGARKPAASKRPAKPAAEGEQPPRPFTIGAALAAIAEASDARFAAPVGDELHGRHFGAMWKLIDAHPRLEEWVRVGRWLAVGGMGRRTDLSVAWLRDSDAFALARTWEENGAPNLGRTPTLAVRGPADPAEEAALAAARRDLEARPRLPLPIATHHGAAH